MSSILGIALVVDDINKGCNLAFRYPAPSTAPTVLDTGSSFHKLSGPLLAKLFRPKNALCNGTFELVIDDLRFISHPVLVTQRSMAPPILSVGSPTAPGSGGNELTMFNIIFALEELPQLAQEDDELQQRRLRSIAAFRSVAGQLANGLLHEELRSAYVSREVRELLHIRDELAQHERAMAMTAGGGGSGGPSGNGTSAVGNIRKDTTNTSESARASIEVDPQTLIDVSLGKSVLANDLKSVYHGLDEYGTVHVVINRWVKLSLTLTDTVALNVNSLRPYQTLLLLVDEEKILDALPPDHSHQLRVLIEAANPLKSFQELALETSIPIHQLFRLSAHLAYWGFARVIDTITMHNIYQVNPQANLQFQSALALAFVRKFAPHELSEVLATFSGSRRIGEYMKNLSGSKKMEYIHMLIWLLQNRFVIQLHRYVYFMIPSEGDLVSEMGSFESHSFRSVGHRRRQTSVARSLSNGVISEPVETMDVTSSPSSLVIPTKPAVNEARQALKLSEQELEYLEKIATTNPVYTLFKRLCVYFHGQYHLEEIMWRENVSRGELRTVLSTYQDIIVCCLHE